LFGIIALTGNGCLEVIRVVNTVLYYSLFIMLLLFVIIMLLIWLYVLR